MSDSGLNLCWDFFVTAVEPILKRHEPDAKVAVARIGRGSEVLGYDTPMSFDHDYGPAVHLFLEERDFPSLAPELLQVLQSELPDKFEGWTVRFPAGFRPDALNIAKRAIGGDHGVDFSLSAAGANGISTET